MKKIIYAIFALAAAACTGNGVEDLTGGVSLSLAPDTSLEAVKKSDDNVSNYAKVPEADEFTVKVSNNSGITAWEGLMKDWDPELKLAVGGYVATASYGSAEDEGIGKPYFFASGRFTIEAFETTLVKLTPTLCNAIVRIAPGDNLKNYFTSYSFSIRTSNGNTFENVGDSEIFVDTYGFTLNGTLTAPDGKPVTVSKQFSDLCEATHYTVTVDADNLGTGAISVKLNDKTETVKIEEDINNED